MGMEGNGNWIDGNGREWECWKPFPHISTSELVIDYKEALYQVYASLPYLTFQLTLNASVGFATTMTCIQYRQHIIRRVVPVSSGRPFSSIRTTTCRSTLWNTAYWYTSTGAPWPRPGPPERPSRFSCSSAISTSSDGWGCGRCSCSTRTIFWFGIDVENHPLIHYYRRTLNFGCPLILALRSSAFIMAHLIFMFLLSELIDCCSNIYPWPIIFVKSPRSQNLQNKGHANNTGFPI